MDYGATHRKGVGACALGDTWATSVPMAGSTLRLERADGGVWQLAGEETARFGLVNDYLGYLADRNYSSQTVRAYGFGLLAFCRWLVEQCIELDAVTTVVLLDFLRACREAKVPGRPSGNVVSMSGQPLDRYAAATINHRLSVTWNLAAAEIISLRYDHGLRRCVGQGSAVGEVAGARPERAGRRLVAGVGRSWSCAPDDGRLRAGAGRVP
jgi:hypothetical protein